LNAALLAFIPLAINVVSSILLILSIEREYVRTFFTTMSGIQYACWNFGNDTEESKFAIFDNHRVYYKPIEKELKLWLSENWSKWESEQPSWFTKEAISYIPNDLAPAALLKKFAATGGRKDSAFAGFRGSVRSSKVAPETQAKNSGTTHKDEINLLSFPMNENE